MIIRTIMTVFMLVVARHYTTLKWDKHITHISLKNSRGTGEIFRQRHIYPIEILLFLYNTLNLSHLSYCILVWS